MKNSILFKEGLPSLIFMFFITVVLYVINPLISLFGIGLIFFVIYFFRDPNRKIPEGQSVILSPADGMITEIREVEENAYFKQKVISISIFMSPLDVHINRSPISGKVNYIQYHQGKFKFAKNPDHFMQNERNYIGIRNDQIQVLVIQVAGIMARRIVNWTTKGQMLHKGEKIGMIKFSSGTQIFLPKECELLIKEGDRVVSGKTIIGRHG